MSNLSILDKSHHLDVKVQVQFERVYSLHLVFIYEWSIFPTSSVINLDTRHDFHNSTLSSITQEYSDICVRGCWENRPGGGVFLEHQPSELMWLLNQDNKSIFVENCDLKFPLPNEIPLKSERTRSLERSQRRLSAWRMIIWAFPGLGNT